MEVLYFSADWCGPCNEFGPRLYDVAKDYPHITVKRIDMDDPDDQMVAFKHKVQVIPALLINDQLHSGTAHEDELRRMLDRVAA